MSIEKIFEHETNENIIRILAQETEAFVITKPGLTRNGHGFVISLVVAEATRRGLIENVPQITQQEVTNEQG